jgi:hypothetical protein
VEKWKSGKQIYTHGDDDLNNISDKTVDYLHYGITVFHIKIWNMMEKEINYKAIVKMN